MATVIRCPDRLTAAQRRTTATVYLAGPFDDGDDTWRDRAIAALDDLDVTILDPRNDRWPDLEVGSAGRRGAYDWQCDSAAGADVVLVWVPDGSVAPTTLLVLGSLGAKRSSASKGNSVVVGGDGHDGLVQLFAQNHRLFPVGPEFEELLRVGRLQVEAAVAATTT